MSMTETKDPIEAARDLAQESPAKAIEMLTVALADSREKARKAEAEFRANSDLTLRNGTLVATNFGGMWRLAQMYSRSQLVPAQFQNKPEDCFIVLELAHRCGISGIAFLQGCYVVHGKPGVETRLAIAMVNGSGAFQDRISWEMNGKEGTDERSATAFALDAKTGKRCEQTVSIATAKSMGWWQKKDSLWPKMPELMLKYRSAMWLIRLYAPEVLMGLYSHDELIDSDETIRDIPSRVVPGPMTIDDLTAGAGVSGIPKTEELPDASELEVVDTATTDTDRNESMEEAATVEEPAQKADGELFSNTEQSEADDPALADLRKRLAAATGIGDVMGIKQGMASKFKAERSNLLDAECKRRRAEIESLVPV